MASLSHRSASMGDATLPIAPAEQYQRGLTLKKAGYYKSALAQFEQAVSDPAYTLRARAQMGLCFRAIGRRDDAVTAFRQALACAGHSKQSTLQLLYVLGRTLESLGRISETLEAYRWIRREDAGYRDVAGRIERLSTHRSMPSGKKLSTGAPAETGRTVKP